MDSILKTKVERDRAQSYKNMADNFLNDIFAKLKILQKWQKH